MTLNKLLESLYDTPDTQSVTVTISTDLGTLRRNSAELGRLRIDASESKAAPAKKTKAKAASKKAKKAAPKAVSAKTSKASASKKTATPAAAGKRRGANTVSRDAVLAAIAKGHTNGPNIAKSMKADVAQVHKALSRYVKSGHVVRVGTGQYALP